MQMSSGQCAPGRHGGVENTHDEGWMVTSKFDNYDDEATTRV
jgi:hypothetical protein